MTLPEGAAAAAGDAWETGRALWQVRPAEYSRCLWRGAEASPGAAAEEDRCPRSAMLGGAVCKEHLALLPKRRDRAAQIMLMAADVAAQRLVDGLQALDERTAMKAAESLLNRTGLSERQNITVTSGSEESGFDAMAKFFVVGEKDEEEPEEDAAEERAGE